MKRTVMADFLQPPDTQSVSVPLSSFTLRPLTATSSDLNPSPSDTKKRDLWRGDEPYAARTHNHDAVIVHASSVRHGLPALDVWKDLKPLPSSLFISYCVFFKFLFF
jgi:hypothetical protein